MQPKYLITTSLIALLLFSNHNSYSQYSDNARNTYIGIDYLYSTTIMPKEFGGNLLSRKKPIPGLSVVLGHIYTEHLGAELGFELDKTKKNQPNIVGNYNSTLKQNNIYLSVNTRLNIIHSLFMSVYIGASRTNISLNTIMTNNYNNNKLFKKKHIMPFIKINLEFNYNKYSLKLFSSCLTSFSKFKIPAKAPSNTKPEMIKIKNILKSGLGLYYYI